MSLAELPVLIPPRPFCRACLVSLCCVCLVSVWIQHPALPRECWRLAAGIPPHLLLLHCPSPSFPNHGCPGQNPSAFLCVFAAGAAFPMVGLCRRGHFAVFWWLQTLYCRSSAWRGRRSWGAAGSGPAPRQRCCSRKGWNQPRRLKLCRESEGYVLFLFIHVNSLVAAWIVSSFFETCILGYCPSADCVKAFPMPLHRRGGSTHWAAQGSVWGRASSLGSQRQYS